MAVQYWSPIIIIAFAADTFVQDKTHLFPVHGKILGTVSGALALLATWYRHLGWELIMGLTMLLGIPKGCFSFIWAKHCFDKASVAAAAAAAAPGENIEQVSTRLCKEQNALGAFEVLFVLFTFWAMSTTKHDVHPSVGKPEVPTWGRRAARPGKESFVRRGVKAMWNAFQQHRDLLWWSCVTIWVSSLSLSTSAARE